MKKKSKNNKSKKRKRYTFDAFIIYASEDRKGVVVPLFADLESRGLRIWYDKFSLRVGQSLHEAVEKGLSKSRFGIVILSPSFLAKPFPRSELNGMFALQMQGKRRILSVWHKIKQAEVVENLPMISDIWAARTEEGIPAVALELVKIIKPEALKLTNTATDAVRATSRYLNHFRKRNPELNFLVTAGDGKFLDAIAKIGNAGALASLFHSGMRIDVFPKDATKYRAKPISASFNLTPKGLPKYLDLIRTGRAQQFDSDEFSDFKTGIVLDLPEAKSGTGKLFISPNDPATKIPVKLKVGSGSDIETISYLQSYIERRGTRESVLIAETTDKAFRISALLSMQGQIEGTINLTLKLEGAELHRVQRYFRAALALQKSGELEIRALDSDSIIFAGKCAVESSSERDIWYEKLIDDVTRVADTLGLQIKWPKKISEKEVELLIWIARGLDGKPFGTGGTFRGEFVKSSESLERFDAFKSGGRMALVPDVPLDFFGSEIEPKSLAILAEHVFIRDFEETRKRLAALSDGSKLDLVYETSDPVAVQLWDKTKNSPKI